MSRREEILAKAAMTPFLPASLCLAAEVVHDESVHPANKIRIIGHDPGLTANLLRLVNEGRAPGERIGSIRQAAALLGTKGTVELLASSGGATACLRSIDGYDQTPAMHFKHSLAVGLSAVKLAAALGVEAPENTFTAGLLAGVGKTVLGSYVNVESEPILKLAMEEGLSFDRAEREILGVSHAEVGAALLKAWNLPRNVVDAVDCHLRPEKSPSRSLLLDLVHVGNFVPKMMGVGLGVDGLNYVTCLEAGKRLNLTAELIDGVSIAVLDSLKALGPLFGEAPEELFPETVHEKDDASEIW